MPKDYRPNYRLGDIKERPETQTGDYIVMTLGFIAIGAMVIWVARDIWQATLGVGLFFFLLAAFSRRK
jgi:hypothetical protein